MKKKVTLADVAAAAGVSMPTVSRVATGTARVSPEIERRVKNAAAELGIDLLRKNKSRVVAFLLSNRDKLHPFHSRVLVGSQEHCARNGYSLVFCPFRYSPTAAWRELRLPHFGERRQRVDGVILGGTNFPGLIDLLDRRRIPFSVLGNNMVGEWNPADHDVVSTDDIVGAYEMTRYLHSLGHQMVWYVGNSLLPWFSRCRQGYERARADGGLPSHAVDFHSEDSQEGGYISTKSILRNGGSVTAIFAGDTAAACGAYRALRDAGLRIPLDVSVAAVGESGGEMLDPPLTRVREFPEQVGTELAKLVLSRVNHPESSPKQLVVPTQLVKRESCGPVSQAGAERDKRHELIAQP